LCYSTTFPPRDAQLAASVVSVQPCPLHEFCPLHDDDAVLQALVPLQEFAPLHLTPPAYAAVARLPAANIAAAVAIKVLLDMELGSLVDGEEPHRYFTAAP
jgi:hypothetical protein